MHHVVTELQNGVLLDFCQMHCGVSDMGLLFLGVGEGLPVGVSVRQNELQ